MDRMRSSPWEWAQRIEGAWTGTTSDRWYSVFADDCVTDKPLGGKLSIAWVMDHGIRPGTETGLLIVWDGPEVLVLDEYESDRASTIDDDVTACLAALRRHHIEPTNVDLAIGDIGSQKGGERLNNEFERTLAARLGRHAPPFRVLTADKSPGSVIWGQRVISQAFRKRRLRVHKRCRRLVYCLQHWKGGKRPGTDDGDLSHLPDTLRYGLVGILGHRPEYAGLRFG
jgi:hypothetical protein